MSTPGDQMNQAPAPSYITDAPPKSPRAVGFANLSFQPGIASNASPRDLVGRYFASNRVRFHKGYPEKIGGWAQQVLLEPNEQPQLVPGSPALLLHFNEVGGSVVPCSLLLHCDGADGSTVFLDSSVNNFTMTPVGATAISDTDPMFGTGEGNFPSAFGIPNRLTTPIIANGPLDLFGPVSGGDFTMEGWVMQPAFSVITVVDYGNSLVGSPNVTLMMSAVGTFQVNANVGGWNSITNTVPIVPGVWYSWALVRKGAVGTCFFNGVALPNQATNWSPNASTSPTEIIIGGA